MWFLLAAALNEDFDNASAVLEEYSLNAHGSVLDNTLRVHYDNVTPLDSWFGIDVYDGKLYLVWSDLREDGEYRLYYNCFNLSDPPVPLFSSAVELVDPPEYAILPQIRVFNETDIYVTFRALPANFTFTRAYLMKINENGTIVWGANQTVKADLTGDIDTTYVWFAKPEVDETGEYVYSFFEYQPYGSGSYVKIRRYFAVNGTYDSAWGTRSLIDSSFQRVGDISFYAGKIYGVTRNWYWYSPTNRGVYVDALNVSANSGSDDLWGDIRLDSADTGYARGAWLLWSDDRSELYVIWWDSSSGSNTGYIRRIDPVTGSPVWASPVAIAPELNTTLVQGTYIGGNIYLVVNDDSRRLYLTALDSSGNVVLSPVQLVSNDRTLGYFDLFAYGGFLYLVYASTDSDFGIRLYLQKFDVYGAPQWASPFKLNLRDYMVMGSATSKRVTKFSPSALSIKSVRVDTITGSGSFDVYVSNDGGKTWFPAPLGTVVDFGSLGTDFRYKVQTSDSTYAYIDALQIEAIDFATADLSLSEDNQTYKGYGITEEAPENQTLEKYIIENSTATVFFNLTNVGTVVANITFQGSNPSTSWNLTYVADGSPVNYDGSYVVSLGAKERKHVLVKVKPVPSLVSEGESKEVFVYSFYNSTSTLPYHDILWSKIIALERLPDAMISSDGVTFSGDDVYEEDWGRWFEKRTDPFGNLYYVKLPVPDVYTLNITQKAQAVVNAFPGREETHVFTLRIQNEGVSSDTGRVYLDVLSGNATKWNLSFNGTAITLPYDAPYASPASGYVDIPISVTPSSAVEDGESVSFKVRIVSDSPFLNVDSSIIEVKAIRVQPDLVLSFDGGSYNYGGVYYSTDGPRFAEVGDTLNYSLKLVNPSGNTPDNITLKITNLPSGWTVTVLDEASNITSSLASGISYSLAGGAYKVFSVYLEPSTLALNSVENLTFEAVSSLRPSVKDTLVLKFECVDVSPSLSAYPVSIRATSSQAVSFEVNLTNTGASNDTVALYIPPAPPGWSLTVSGPSDKYGSTPSLDAVLYYDVTPSGVVALSFNATPVSAAVNVVSSFVIDANSTLISYERSSVTVNMTMVDVVPVLQPLPQPLNTVVNNTAFLTFRIENSGSSSESYVFKENAVSSTGVSTWGVEYFIPTNGTNITDYVKGSGWTTDEISAGGHFDILVKVVPTAGSPGDSISINCSVISVTNPLISDEAVGNVTISSGYPDVYISDGAALYGNRTVYPAEQSFVFYLEEGENFTGSVVLVNLDPNNSGGFDYSYSFSKDASSPDPYFAIVPDFNATSDTFLASQEKEFNVTFSMPSVSSGTEYNLTFQARLSAAPTIKDVVQVRFVKVSPSLRLALVLPESRVWDPSTFIYTDSSLSVNRGDTLNYYVALINDDGAEAYYNLTASGTFEGWSVSFYDEANNPVDLISGMTVMVPPKSYVLFRVSVASGKDTDEFKPCDLSFQAFSLKKPSLRRKISLEVSLRHLFLYGKVLGPGGKPVSGAEIKIKGMFGERKTVSDSSGAYRFYLPYLLGQDVMLEASTEGLASARRALTVNSEETRVDLFLARVDIKEAIRVYPTVVTDSLNILVKVPAGERYIVAVYDLRGRLVYRIAEGVSSGGIEQLVWDLQNEVGEHIVPGVYLVAIKYGEERLVRKVFVRR